MGRIGLPPALLAGTPAGAYQPRRRRRQLNGDGWQDVSDCRTEVVSDFCNGLFQHSERAPDQSAYISLYEDQVYNITLNQPDLRVGDLWLAFGDPDFSMSTTPYESDHPAGAEV